MFVSIHIPKTAGTVLGYLFDHGSGRKVLWDYSDDYSNASFINPLWIEHISFIKEYFWGIHGHFYFTKYQHLLADEKFITCIRHPVARLESQFRHELHEAIAGVNTWRSDDLRTGRMQFVDFVKSDENTRLAQVEHLKGRDITAYDFVFVDSMLESGLAAFARKFGFQRRDSDATTGIPVINDNKTRRFEHEGQAREQFEKLGHVSEAERVAVYGCIPEEVELFKAGCDYALRLIQAAK